MIKPTRMTIEVEGEDVLELAQWLSNQSLTPITSKAPVANSVVERPARVTKATTKTALPAQSTVDLKTISTLFVNLANSKGHTAAVEILKRFDVASVPAIKATQYADIASALQIALDAE